MCRKIIKDQNLWVVDGTGLTEILWFVRFRTVSSSVDEWTENQVAST
jgi:hypothetical protein